MKIYRPKLIEGKTSEELKEGVIHELRVLMVNFGSLIESEHRIRKIQLSKFLLDDRKDGVFEKVEQLENETKWKFNQLFEDCIAYPDKSIYPSKYYSQEIKENSICDICEAYKKEITEQPLKICNNCLLDCEKAIDNQIPLEEVFLFKTPEKEYWCTHANEETLLLSTDKYYVAASSIICKECVIEEKIKRRKNQHPIKQSI